MYWVTAILGFSLMLTPFVFGYTDNAPALWTSILVGMATFGFSWLEGAQHDKETWEYWTVGLLGAIAIVSPFVLGFTELTTALWSSIVLGVLISVFAATKLSMTVRHKTRRISW